MLSLLLHQKTLLIQGSCLSEYDSVPKVTSYLSFLRAGLAFGGALGLLNAGVLASDEESFSAGCCPLRSAILSLSLCSRSHLSR